MTIERDSDADAPLVDNYHLLVIGVERYANYQRLPNAVRDAAAVADLLTTKYSFDRPDNFDDLRDIDKDYQDSRYTTALPVFKSQYTTCLYNEDATVDAVINMLDQYSGALQQPKLGENDALLIYFAGHGMVSNKNYHLLLHDSEPGKSRTSLAVSDIAKYFNNFPEQNHTRHLLLVLDSCFAGSASTGSFVAYSGHGRLSRQVLTSCAPDEPADDGIIFNGSEFANAFVAALREHQTPAFVVDDIVTQIKSKVESDAEKLIESQTVSMTPMPHITNGTDSFPFRRRSVDRPDIDHLRESIIEDLDFFPQREDLLNYYDSTRSHLNIVTTSGNNIRAHKMLSKVILRWFSETEGMTFKPDICYVPAVINLDLHGDEAIFDIINKSIRTPGQDYDPASIFQWFVDQMKTTKSEWYKLRHAIIRIEFNGSPDKRVDQVDKFCNEFSRLYKSWSDKLPANEKDQYGNIFILISDSSAAGLDYSAKVLSGVPAGYNFIPVVRISGMNINHIRTWLTKFRKKNQSGLVKAMTAAMINTRFANPEYGHDEVIDEFCRYCEFDQPEIDLLNAQLYDYNKTFLI